MMSKKEYFIQQRLIAITATDHHVNGSQQANLIDSTLKRIGCKIDALIALCADRAGANAVTAEVLSGAEERAIDELIMKQFPNLNIFLVGCFSHTFDKVGKKFDAPELKEFMAAVRGLVGLSNVAQRMFRENDVNGKNLAGYAAIRWWNDWVQQVQINDMGLDVFDTMAAELQQQELCKASSQKILEILRNPTKRARLGVQMAASIERGKPFCKLGFNLEGDGPLAFVTGKCVKSAFEAVSNMVSTPLIDAASVAAEKLVAPLAAIVLKNVADAANGVTAVRSEIVNLEKKIKRLSKRTRIEAPVLKVDDLVVGSRKHNSNINRRLKGKIKAVIMDENGTYWYDILYDGDDADDLTREFEYPMYKKSNLGPRDSEKKQREFMTKQEATTVKIKK